MGDRLIRMQDAEGRGPWRPGFSSKWLDQNSAVPLPPSGFEEVPNLSEIVSAAHERGQHVGFALRKSKLSAWFNRAELHRLRRLGFFLVDCADCDVLVETQWQALVGSKRPLRALCKIADITRHPNKQVYSDG